MRDPSLPPSAPPMATQHELPYEAATQVPPSTQFQPPPTLPPPYARLPPPYTVNVNDPIPVPEPETRVIYVVQNPSECSVIGRLCCIRLLGVIMGLIIAGIIITFVTSTTSHSRSPY